MATLLNMQMKVIMRSPISSLPSCYLESSNSKIIVSVSGPKPRPRSSTSPLHITIKFSPFSGQKRSPLRPNPRDREHARIIHSALMPSLRAEEYASSMIDVSIQVLEARDVLQALSESITASSVALVEAGVEVWDLCVGVVASGGGSGAACVQNGEDAVCQFASFFCHFGGSGIRLGI